MTSLVQSAIVPALGGSFLQIQSDIYILLQIVLGLAGPHQCSADERMEVKLEKPPRMLHACGNI